LRVESASTSPHIEFRITNSVPAALATVLKAPDSLECNHAVLTIGPYALANRVFAAPMAGVTDRPYRRLCRQLGAGYAVSEMAASNPNLWASEKTARRLNHDGEKTPIAVQLAGADPAMLVEAAVYNVRRGAQIIDINMGCPAKKVCNVACGSALLRDEDRVRVILDAVVAAVAPLGDVPVTLKFRTGWDPENRNALRIARIAQESGVRMLTLHGRTRACGFGGVAEYETIAAVKRAVTIPVVANGDIDSPERARAVLDATGADAVMVGRAALGRPWIFREIEHFLRTGRHAPAPRVDEVRPLLAAHLDDHHRFYGRTLGVRTARKHIIWYTRALPGGTAFCDHMNTIDDCGAQARAVDDFLREHADRFGNELHASISQGSARTH
jgi:tRNA-dihydrouridine synthase B